MLGASRDEPEHRRSKADTETSREYFYRDEPSITYSRLVISRLVSVFLGGIKL
jgi:hypothetical protein